MVQRSQSLISFLINQYRCVSTSHIYLVFLLFLLVSKNVGKGYCRYLGQTNIVEEKWMLWSFLFSNSLKIFSCTIIYKLEYLQHYQCVLVYLTSLVISLILFSPLQLLICVWFDWIWLCFTVDLWVLGPDIYWWIYDKILLLCVCTFYFKLQHAPVLRWLVLVWQCLISRHDYVICLEMFFYKAIGFQLFWHIACWSIHSTWVGRQ